MSSTRHTKTADEDTFKHGFGSKVVFIFTSSWLLALTTLSLCCGEVISGISSLLLALFYWVVSLKRLHKSLTIESEFDLSLVIAKTKGK